MKRLILAAIGLGTLVAVGFYINHPTATKPAEIIVEPTEDSTLTQTPSQTRMAQSLQIAPEYVAAEQTLENPTDSNGPKPVVSAASITTTARLVFNQAIETMVENARRKKALRHGGRQQRLDIRDVEIAAAASDDELLAINEALERFAVRDERKAELVELRYFGGLKVEEAAKVLGISEPTAKRWWAYARARLFREINSHDCGSGN